MLGHTLKLIRLYNNIDVNAAAIHLNLWPKNLGKIESCKANVSLSTLGRFSKLYQMPISQILILNDMKEHFQISDSVLWEDIERFYITKQDEPEQKSKSKNSRYKHVNK